LFVTVERNQDKAAGIVLPSADEATAGRTPAMAARVGDYLLFETLGTGAFGTVRAAVHAPTGDQVAIKVLDKAVVRHTETALNVRREIAISKALDHPNVVRLRAVLSSATRIYVVLDLVRGKDLYYVSLQRATAASACLLRCPTSLSSSSVCSTVTCAASSIVT
jgi:serine/threonine protein kinase